MNRINKEFKKNLPLASRYSDFLKNQDIDPSLMACVDQKHIRYGDVDFSKSLPFQKHKYDGLYVDRQHLEALGVDYEYFDGNKVKPIYSAHGLSDWNFEDCETYLTIGNWGSVAHYTEAYSLQP